MEYLLQYMMDDSVVGFDIIDKNGNGFDSNGEYFDNGTQQAAYEPVMRGEYHLHGPYKSAINDQLLVKYSVPIKYNNEVVGILCLIKDGLNFSELIQNIKFLNTGHAFLFNAQGTIIASNNTEAVYSAFNPITAAEEDEQFNDFATAITAVLNGEKIHKTYSINGVDSFISYAHIPLTNWNVVLVVEKSDLLAGVISLQTLLSVLILLALIIVCLSLLLIIIKLCSKLIYLNATITTFANGDFSGTIPEKLLNVKDEI